MTFDLYLVGVGGQGVLTIGEIVTQAAVQQGIPASFFPTKGMAQRGGLVKAEVRLGREAPGPHLPETGADLVIAMELSEALRAVRYIKPGKEFLLFGQVWQPTAVMLGKAPYPALAQVREQVEGAGGKLIYLDPKAVPDLEGAAVPANIYLLGAALGQTALGELLDASRVAEIVRDRWKRGAVRNEVAFNAGLGPANEGGTE
jgi:indolepyruvate ferredoxin oxidoreductase beta subunit